MAKSVTKRIKAGTSSVSRQERIALFIEAYLANGRNGTQAAISAGVSPKGAGVWASRALKEANISGALQERKEKILFDAQLTTERWAAETGLRAHFDPGELYDAQGCLIPIHLLPEHVRRAISLEIPLADGTKLKTPNKDAALADVGKHLGVFERDNMQKRDDIEVMIELIRCSPGN